MKYDAIALTPLLVGDGQELSPVDYMVWKDQVNVLDQPRIFKLLSRGPRLDGYLSQLRKADKLDFASWGGFAQNFSARRIPFEHASSTGVWEKTAAELLFIPTFAADYRGAYLPGSALKGALRTGLVASRWSPATMEKLVSATGNERLSRRTSEAAESTAGASQVRILAAADSEAVARSSFKVYLTRVANLDTRAAASQQISWKVAGRGNVPNSRVVESTPMFAEMAAPGTKFSGDLFERTFLGNPEFAKALGWRSTPTPDLLIKTANEWASAQLEQHSKFAQSAGLPKLQQTIQKLKSELEVAAETQSTCLLCLGWGGGFLSKSSFTNTALPAFQTLLKNVPAFSRAIKDDAPFPKTRRVVFAGGEATYLPGWLKIELTSKGPAEFI